MLFQEFSAWKVLSSICSLLVAPGLLKLMCRIWAHCSQYLWTPLADDLIKCSYWTISDQLLKKELGGGGSREKPHRQWDLVYRPEESLQGLNWEVCHDGNLCLGICHGGVGFVPWIPLRCDHNFFSLKRNLHFIPLATRMETRLPWRPTRGSLTSPSYLHTLWGFLLCWKQSFFLVCETFSYSFFSYFEKWKG